MRALLLPVAVLACLLPACASAGRDSRRARSTTGEDLSALADRLLEEGRFRAEAWRLDLSAVTGEPTRARLLQVEGDLLFVQDDRHLVHAIDTGHGIHRWVVSMGAELSHPVGRGDQDVVLISEDRLMAVDESSGSRVTGRPVLRLSFWPWSEGTEANRVLLVSSGAPFGVQAVDATTGAAGWRYDTRAPVQELHTFGSGSTANVLAVSEDGLVVSLRPVPASSRGPGAETWYRRLPGTRPGGLGALVGDHLYLGATDGFLYAIQAQTGVVTWKSSVGAPILGAAAPLVAGGQVYVSAGGALIAFESEFGGEVWRHEGGLRGITRLGDLVYVEHDQGEVAVLRATDATEVARFSAEGLVLPTVQGGGLFLAGTPSGELLALQ